MKRFILIAMVLMFPVCIVSAEPELDVFHARESFPFDAFHGPEGEARLDRAATEDRKNVLKSYLDLESKEKDRSRRNLLNLAIGYLYLEIGEPGEADKALDRILGNFVLEDFRFYFQARANRDMGRKKFEDKKYLSAADLWRQALNLYSKIYQLYPESPFIRLLNRDIAETERLIGDAYYQAMNYKSAWGAYRRALMRGFADNERHVLEVNLSLAKTYASANDLDEAADIYLWLGGRYDDPAFWTDVEEFVSLAQKGKKDGEPYFRKVSEMRERHLHPGLADTGQAANAKPTYGNGMDAENAAVRDYEEFLSRDDFPGLVRRAWEVLKNYPGIESSSRIMQSVNKRIVGYLGDHPWNPLIEPLMDLYPAKTLSDLALQLWKINQPESAAEVYRKILQRYPLDVEMGHKCLYFLGRIYEDRKRFDEALGYYRRLLKEYDYGPYTTASFFKVPWVLRLAGKLQEASVEFNNLIEYYQSYRFERLNQKFPDSLAFKSAARYWLAKTALALGNEGEASRQRLKLIEEFPLSFYAIVSRGEIGIGLETLFQGQEAPEEVRRVAGMSDLQKKRLVRGEALIALGMVDYGVEELSRVPAYDHDEPGFLFYLARMFQRGGEYRKSLLLIGSLVDSRETGALGKSLAELLYPRPYWSLVEPVANERSLEAFLVLALMRQESAFDAGILSSANAVGLMQLLPSTAAQVARSLSASEPGVEELKKPEVNLQLGTAYLKQVLKEFNYQPVYALASYNAGPHKIREWKAIWPELDIMEFIEMIPYNETRGYVKRVLRNYYVYSAFYQNAPYRKVEELTGLTGEDK